MSKIPQSTKFLCFKNLGCATSNIPTYTNIYHHRPGKVNSRDCQGSHASGQGEDEDDGIHVFFFFAWKDPESGDRCFYWELVWDIYIYIQLYICWFESVDGKLADWCWFWFLKKLLAFLCWWHEGPWGGTYYPYVCLTCSIGFMQSISLALCQVYPFSHTLVERKPILEGPMFHWTMIVGELASPLVHFSRHGVVMQKTSSWLQNLGVT